ncbi:DUF420 domain-containing protein [Rhizosphaericola mali]|uniref:DUF420 domain-containing protein n=2 Tax=Rhizosphaericola mali TaxID=2545455 RepID=A0A5P2GCF3_9BACT|nr:DUF420 domain-containing protein [Rhizosphaericola mali]
MQQKQYKKTIVLLTVAINGLIALAYFLPKHSLFKSLHYSLIPLANATLNGLTFLSLVAAFISIRRKKIKTHRFFVLLAFAFTSIFLVLYLLYHFSMPTTKFGGSDSMKLFYLFILLTHIILAAVIVPLALYTMSLALTHQISKHRKIAKWSMPIWLYVSFTGVLVYILISPYYA